LVSDLVEAVSDSQACQQAESADDYDTEEPMTGAACRWLFLENVHIFAGRRKASAPDTDE
jgi:hypothetical protein